MKPILLLPGILLLATASAVNVESPQKASGFKGPAQGVQRPRDQTPSWLMPPVEGANLHYKTFDSKAAGTKVSYLIYLPPDYETAKDRRYPVVYWLHGIGGSQQGVPAMAERMTKAIAEGKTPSMIVVYVNGMIRSSYVDSADGKTPVETVTIKELIPHVDATYRTIATREGRMIEGFSMGGSGAAKWGFKYPDLFGSISILDGALHSSNDATSGPMAETFKTVYGGDKARLEANDPWKLAEKNAGKIKGRTAIRIVTRTTGLGGANTKFHELLDSLGLENEFHTIPDAIHSPNPLYEGLGDDNWAFYRKAFGMPDAGKASVAAASAKPPAVAPAVPALRAAPEPASAGAPKQGFQLNGERWTWSGDGAPLQGILLKPEGNGPFPAIIISHGMGGSAQSFGLSKAREMVKWGFVCIATDYTHAGRSGEYDGQRRSAQRPTGLDKGATTSPAAPSLARPEARTTSGSAAQRSQGPGRGARPRDAGASAENLRRALKCLEILKSLPYVDAKRVCAYGNSMGAFLTIALAAQAPDSIAVAAITAGGVRTTPEGGFSSPTTGVAERIRCPFLIIHGAADGTVRPEMSLALKQVLDRNGVANERVVFDGIGHNAHADKADEVYRLMREWFTKHGALRTSPGRP